MFFFFFFFKQKTAYEMRISDWSSDVCSSDLPFARQLVDQMAEAAAEATEHVVLAELDIVEEQLRGIGRMQADLVEIAAALETGQRGVEREQRRALGDRKRGV